MLIKRKLYFTLLYLLLLTALLLSFCSFSQKEDPITETAAKVYGKTLLLLGIDSSSYSSDVILLAHIDSDGEHLKMLQIPRDTYTVKGKINSIFSHACTSALNQGESEEDAFASGARALGDFLQENLGITVDHYGVLTLSDFRALVDGIGGVPITLPRDLDYEDPAQNLSIHLKAGEQLLDGEAAEGFVRCRNAYPNADYGRMDAQKLFMSAFFKKLKYNTSLPDLITFITYAHRSVKTSIALKEAFAIGKAVLFAKGEALVFATLKGEALKLDGKWYEVLPRENLEKAALWFEATLPEGSAQNAFGKDGIPLSLYLSAPTSPFTPHSAKEMEE